MLHRFFSSQVPMLHMKLAQQLSLLQIYHIIGLILA